MHWDDELDKLIRRERERKRWEEKPLHDRITQLEAALFDAQKEIRHLWKEKWECYERTQAVALGQVFPGPELAALKKVLEEAWLELVLVASPKAQALSQIIQLLERYFPDQNPQ
ncbi:hypothetical protein [Thermus sp.]|uniref:hypothetical protein n=1 Tax=Thermus sp. TaxID=275 RepID=UPI00391B7F14